VLETRMYFCLFSRLQQTLKVEDERASQMCQPHVFGLLHRVLVEKVWQVCLDEQQAACLRKKMALTGTLASRLSTMTRYKRAYSMRGA